MSNRLAMSPETHQRVRQLFDEALERPEAERMAFLQAACTGSSEVFRQVAELLAAHAEAGRFLEGEPARPQRVGRYMVTGELGRGAMAIVYEAIDPLIGRKVAVKVIRLQALANGSEAAFLRERLFREARSAGRLFHPGIVIILDVGREGDVAFIAMEYVEGPSLFQVLAARPTIDRAEALQILRQTAAALDFAHGNGVVHRDIKPANIMLEKGVTVKVTDFGIAKITSSRQYTQTGFPMGTPIYMSPEQVDAKALDGKSDQFSLAVVAYELMTGAIPFQAESLTALAHLIVYGPRPSACAANPELPAGVDEVFCRGLGRLAEERYANCREFVAALEQALTPQVAADGATAVTVPPSSITPASQNRARRPFRYMVGVAVAAMLLVGVWLGYKRFTRTPPPAPTSPPALARQTPSLPAVPDIARFSADQQSIAAGAQATLRWKVSGVTEVTVEPGIGKKPAADSVLVKPARSTYYVLFAANAAGTVFQEVFVEVKPVSPLSPLLLRVEGESMFRKKQFAEGLARLREAGGLGETRAMVELGDIYWDGKEGQIKKDEPEALRWYRKAAEAGDPEGMRNLGAFYDMGIGVAEDPGSAALWYRRASDRGSSDAAYNLGSMYETGRGVPRDLGKAREFYQRAAKMGNAEAKKQLIQLGSH